MTSIAERIQRAVERAKLRVSRYSAHDVSGEISLAERVKAAAARTHRTPSEAQVKAGNYPKGRFWYHGLEIAIETPKGAKRNGHSIPLSHSYGYFKRTLGADGDQLDVFICPHPESELVFVVDQQKANGRWDEHKVIVGASSEAEAKAAYLASYPPGWRCGPITAMTVGQFVAWVRSGNPKKPIAGQVSKYAKDVSDEKRDENGQWTRDGGETAHSDIGEREAISGLKSHGYVIDDKSRKDISGHVTYEVRKGATGKSMRMSIQQMRGRISDERRIEKSSEKIDRLLKSGAKVEQAAFKKGEEIIKTGPLHLGSMVPGGVTQDVTAGFVTKDGTFLTREEAALLIDGSRMMTGEKLQEYKQNGYSRHDRIFRAVQRYAHDVSAEKRDQSGQWTKGSEKSGDEPTEEIPKPEKNKLAKSSALDAYKAGGGDLSHPENQKQIRRWMNAHVKGNVTKVVKNESENGDNEDDNGDRLDEAEAPVRPAVIKGLNELAKNDRSRLEELASEHSGEDIPNEACEQYVRKFLNSRNRDQLMDLHDIYSPQGAYLPNDNNWVEADENKDRAGDWTDDQIRDAIIGEDKDWRGLAEGMEDDVIDAKGNGLQVDYYEKMPVKDLIERATNGLKTNAEWRDAYEVFFDEDVPSIPLKDFHQVTPDLAKALKRRGEAIRKLHGMLIWGRKAKTDPMNDPVLHDIAAEHGALHGQENADKYSRSAPVQYCTEMSDEEKQRRIQRVLDRYKKVWTDEDEKKHPRAEGGQFTSGSGSVSQIVPEAIKAGLFDHASVYDTNSNSAVKIASSNGTQLSVHNPQLWGRFMQKASE